MTNLDNQYHNLLSRAIFSLAEHYTKNHNLRSVSVQPIESDISTRNENHEPRYQFRKRKRNNPDDEEDEQWAKVIKALIAITIQNLVEGDIKHTIVATLYTYQINSQLKDKIALNLTVLPADI
jgi:hypothetical protein